LAKHIDKRINLECVYQIVWAAHPWSLFPHSKLEVQLHPLEADSITNRKRGTELEKLREN
jgi:hypothetical protein